MQSSLDTPWKIGNQFRRYATLPFARLLFLSNGIPWGRGWQLYGLPIIQKHRQSAMRFGDYLGLRSTLRSNPLGPSHPVILCTWQAGACLEIGDYFGMTGGSIVCAQRITIGDHVTVGANTTLIDTDFHPIEAQERRTHPADATTAPIVIEDDVFIGMNCLILKGVTIGRGSVIGAGSVVVKSIPPGVIAAGNPAQVVGPVL
jgi:acetyltransferase-like isoleucine patch superfamily enzyme